MLHKDPFIIPPEVFRLIQELQAMPELNGFHLVGGTALALQLGHRNSIDIDLVTVNEFDENIDSPKLVKPLPLSTNNRTDTRSNIKA